MINWKNALYAGLLSVLMSAEAYASPSSFGCKTHKECFTFVPQYLHKRCEFGKKEFNKLGSSIDSADAKKADKVVVFFEGDGKPFHMFYFSGSNAEPYGSKRSAVISKDLYNLLVGSGKCSGSDLYNVGQKSLENKTETKKEKLAEKKTETNFQKPAGKKVETKNVQKPNVNEQKPADKVQKPNSLLNNNNNKTNANSETNTDIRNDAYESIVDALKTGSNSIMASALERFLADYGVASGNFGLCFGLDGKGVEEYNARRSQLEHELIGNDGAVIKDVGLDKLVYAHACLNAKAPSNSKTKRRTLSLQKPNEFFGKNFKPNAKSNLALVLYYISETTRQLNAPLNAKYKNEDNVPVKIARQTILFGNSEGVVKDGKVIVLKQKDTVKVGNLAPVDFKFFDSFALDVMRNNLGVDVDNLFEKNLKSVLELFLPYALNMRNEEIALGRRKEEAKDYKKRLLKEVIEE